MSFFLAAGMLYKPQGKLCQARNLTQLNIGLCIRDMGNTKKLAMKTTKSITALMGCVSLLAAGANANTFTFDTAPGSSVGDGPVNAEAVFTTSANSLTILLSDLLADPTSVGQLISDIDFTFAGNISSSGTSLTSTTGTGVDINGSGHTSADTVPSNAWMLNGFHLTALGGGQPKGLIIGPSGAGGVYDKANGSIADNGPHNPFYSGSATFTLNIPGLTAASIVNGAIFSFGTQEGVDVPGIPRVPDGGATIILLGAALSGLGLVRYKLS